MRLYSNRPARLTSRQLRLRVSPPRALHENRAAPRIPPRGGVVLLVRGASKTHEENNRSEEHTSELQSHLNLVCRLLLEKKNPNFGRRVRNRRQLNSLQNTWPYGYHMP